MHRAPAVFAKSIAGICGKAQQRPVLWGPASWILRLKRVERGSERKPLVGQKQTTSTYLEPCICVLILGLFALCLTFTWLFYFLRERQTNGKTSHG